jgi:hypothetical protein
MATDITLTDLTNSTTVSNGVSDGTGVFDKLMNSVNLYLTDQEESGKLKGTDYANVLLGSMQAVLQQSIQFTLQEKLTEAQIDQIQKQTDNLENQDLLTLAQIGKTKIEADVSAALGTKEVDLKVQQIAQVSTEIKVIEQKIVGRKQTNMVGE